MSGEERRPEIIVVSPSSPRESGRVEIEAGGGVVVDDDDVNNEDGRDEDPDTLYITSIAAGLRARRRRRARRRQEGGESDTEEGSSGQEQQETERARSPWTLNWTDVASSQEERRSRLESARRTQSVQQTNDNARQLGFDAIWRNTPFDVLRPDTDIGDGRRSRDDEFVVSFGQTAQRILSTIDHQTAQTTETEGRDARYYTREPDSLLFEARSGRIDNEIIARRRTGFSMRQTLRMKKDCMLLYCGKHATRPIGSAQPAPSGGCGQLVCARALSGPSFAAFASNSDSPTPSFMSDYPPPASKLAYVSTNPDTAGNVETRLVYLDQPECRGCVVIDVGCRNCGQVVGFRVINACTDCSKPRATHQGLRWFFDASVLEARHRMFDTAPELELAPPDVDLVDGDADRCPPSPPASYTEFAGVRIHTYDTDQPGPPRGSKLKWSRVPPPADDVALGLASRPSEWSRTAHLTHLPAPFSAETRPSSSSAAPSSQQGLSNRTRMRPSLFSNEPEASASAGLRRARAVPASAFTVDTSADGGQNQRQRLLEEQRRQSRRLDSIFSPRSPDADIDVPSLWDTSPSGNNRDNNDGDDDVPLVGLMPSSSLRRSRALRVPSTTDPLSSSSHETQQARRRTVSQQLAAGLSRIRSRSEYAADEEEEADALEEETREIRRRRVEENAVNILQVQRRSRAARERAGR